MWSLPLSVYPTQICASAQFEPALTCHKYLMPTFDLEPIRELEWKSRFEWMNIANPKFGTATRQAVPDVNGSQPSKLVKSFCRVDRMHCCYLGQNWWGNLSHISNVKMSWPHIHDATLNQLSTQIIQASRSEIGFLHTTIQEQAVGPAYHHHSTNMKLVLLKALMSQTVL